MKTKYCSTEVFGQFADMPVIVRQSEGNRFANWWAMAIAALATPGAKDTGLRRQTRLKPAAGVGSGAMRGGQFNTLSGKELLWSGTKGSSNNNGSISHTRNG